MLSFSKGMAQDPAFSQSYANPLYLSPSFTGFTNGSRVALSYRDQWPGIPNSFRTYSFSFDHYLPQYKSGIGLLLMRDDRGAGMLVTQDAGLLYSYEIKINRTVYVRPGIQFKYSERKIDPSKIIFSDQLGDDGSLLPGAVASFDKTSFRKMDAGASVMVYSDFFWVGGTVDHLIKSNIGFTDQETRVPIKMNFFGGYKIKYKEGYRHRDEQSVTISTGYYRQGLFQQMDLGAYWYMNPLEIGLLYRGVPVLPSNVFSNNDALIMMLGLNFGPMRFAYSYDLTTSDLAGYSNGANEISFIYRFNQVYRKRQNRGAIPCSAPGVLMGNPAKYRSAPRKIF
jgi:type IX secretion system PorP/SprF family membrane protein